MEKINIYIHTSIRSVRQQAMGFIIWVLEFMTSKGEPATITNKKEITASWKEAELTALTQALSRVKKPCELTIYTENINIISSLNNGWVDKWAVNDWKNAKGEQIENADKWQELHKAIAIHTVSQALDKENEYTSWMYSECGEEMKETEKQYLRARATLEHIIESLESLDITTVEKNTDLKNLITDSTEILFEKFGFLRTGKNTGFVKIENEESKEKTLYTEDCKSTDSVITVH